MLYVLHKTTTSPLKSLTYIQKTVHSTNLNLSKLLFKKASRCYRENINNKNKTPLNKAFFPFVNRTSYSTPS